MLTALVIVLLGIAAVSVWVRTRPVPEDALAWPKGDWSIGDHVESTGIVAVRAPDDPDVAYGDLARIIEDAPRTTLREGGPGQGRLIAVTRTRILGFPDVTHLWTEDGRVLISGHLVMGKSDMGVNARRVRGWLADAGLDGDGA
ncbi:DUF1499 domain-containing protein [Palleronia sp. LCG004]|uniref:DUF1499 domain-containing protein n=1 Tax=Palleronia sp. LCG004 TaxID=3079304 RepID=UPI0029425416|nr:DUF1499 domain-containing protein [Palleronia sp. LCG004]WOI55212.1 DUF1499 domain-containing protein [Palleronia sp. LCG004]